MEAWRRGGRNEQRGDALRVLRVDDAGEDFAGELQQFDAVREPARGVDAVADEDGFERKAAADCLAEQCLSLDGDQAAGEARVSREGGAKLLDARVDAAGNEGRGHSEILRCARHWCGQM